MNRRAAWRFVRATLALVGILLLAIALLAAWRAPGQFAGWMLAASLCG